MTVEELSFTGGEAEADVRFATARRVADAVLFEGYVLYPYRASAAKNRLRWQFGVLVPPAWAEAVAEHCDQRTECLMEPRSGASLLVELRFLRVQRRTVHEGPADGPAREVDALELADRVLCPWDEGVEERVHLTVPVDRLAGDGVVETFRIEARSEQEPVRDASGDVVGHLVRRCAAVSGTIELRTAEIPGPYRTLRLSAVVRNVSPSTPADGAPAERGAALPDALVSAHLLLGLSAGSFLSLADPPEWAKGAAAACRNERSWPALAGADGGADVVLCSPIILEDHPAIAPESIGTMYDATEIDEILALRTAALTEQEKREARGTDPRAAAVVDLAEGMPPEVLDRLHGAIRGLREITGEGGAGAIDLVDTDAVPRPDKPWWDPGSDRSVDPSRDSVEVAGGSVAAGSRVVLRPGLRRTDAQDLFMRGRTALVEAVLRDVDGGVHLAVTLEDDPGADIQRAQGRFLYFQPDEVALEVRP